MEIVKKDAMKSYWSVESVLSTPFPRMSCHVQSLTTFSILSFLHCCSKGQPGYDLRKKTWKTSY